MSEENYPIYYDGRDLDKLLARMQEAQKTNKTIIIGPQSVGIKPEEKPTHFPNDPYQY